jgi:hypothetical protein
MSKRAICACAVAFLAALATAGISPAAATRQCSPQIARFRSIIDSDARTGNLNGAVYARMQPDLQRVIGECEAGHTGEALRDLHRVKAHYGYR